MTARFTASQGCAIRLGRELGSGGEGAVFEIQGDQARVAKIYHRAAVPEKAEKLRAMAAVASRELTAFASWPLDVLHAEGSKEVAGILLPRVRDHDEIHKLYSPAQRKFEYPDKDWGFLIHTAMNCAAAFDAIHSNGHVIGDVNQGNVLVWRKGTVFLIDCDSFQVHSGDRWYWCDVGVPQFTPPELQGQNYRGLERTANHDCFGLALLVFHLLVMGRHPFAGRFSGAGDMPIERAIAEFRYAFSRQADRLQMSRPPQMLPIEILTPQLAAFFERAFDRGSQLPDARPTAVQWHAALQEFSQQLQVCSADRGHRFAAEIRRCPWCDLMLLGAPNFFLSVTFKATSPEALNPSAELRSLWSAIESVPRPTAVPLPAVPAEALQVAPTPPPPAVESAHALATMVSYVAIGSLLATPLIAVQNMSALIIVPMFCVFAAWWLLLFLTSGHRPERRRRRRALKTRRTELSQLANHWKSESARNFAQHALVMRELVGARDQLQKLRGQYDVEFSKLGRELVKRQREEYLRSKFIADHRIDGIGPGRKSTLASYGVETAYDVQYNRVLAIPGFDAPVTNNLCAWRQGIERQFTLSQAQNVSGSERQALLMKYVQIKQQLELKLRQGPDRLRRAELQMREALSLLGPRLAAVEIATAQARADVLAVSPGKVRGSSF